MQLCHICLVLSIHTEKSLFARKIEPEVANQQSTYEADLDYSNLPGWNEEYVDLNELQNQNIRLRNFLIIINFRLTDRPEVNMFLKLKKKTIVWFDSKI